MASITWHYKTDINYNNDSEVLLGAIIHRPDAPHPWYLKINKYNVNYNLQDHYKNNSFIHKGMRTLLQSIYVFFYRTVYDLPLSLSTRLTQYNHVIQM